MAGIAKLKKAPIPVELDRTRHLRYTLGSFAYLEEKYGSIQAAFEQTEKGSIRAVIDVLYAGLKSEDPTLTPDQVADLIDVQDIEDIANCVAKAVAQAQPTGVNSQAPLAQASK